MLRFSGLLTAAAVLGSVVSTTSGNDVPPETLAALGLSGLRVIPVHTQTNWSVWQPPGFVPYDARPYEPGIQAYTLPTRIYLNRRLTNLP